MTTATAPAVEKRKKPWTKARVIDLIIDIFCFVIVGAASLTCILPFIHILAKSLSDNAWVVQDAYDLQKKGESGGIITPIFSKAVQATTEYSADLNSLWQEAYVDCVTCSPDEFESKYEEYCQEYLDAGYQEILDEKASLIADGNVLVVK